MGTGGARAAAGVRFLLAADYGLRRGLNARVRGRWRRAVLPVFVLPGTYYVTDDMRGSRRGGRERGEEVEGRPPGDWLLARSHGVRSSDAGGS